MAENNLEVCENCGRQMGKLETPMIWQEHVVCLVCHTRLTSRLGAARGVRAVANAPMLRGETQVSEGERVGSLATASLVVAIIGIVVPPLLLVAFVLAEVAYYTAGDGRTKTRP